MSTDEGKEADFVLVTLVAVDSRPYKVYLFVSVAGSTVPNAPVTSSMTHNKMIDCVTLESIN